jgi:ATP-dependent DNA ligase
VLDCEVISTNPEAETNVRCLTQLQSTAAILALNPADSIKVQKKSPLKFIVFDCLQDGDKLIDSIWIERHKHAMKLTSMLRKSGFCCDINPVVENTDKYPDAKRDFYDRIVSNNGEGIVLKNKNAVYHATSSRTIDCVKVKRSTADNTASDIDAFITDYVVGTDGTRNENTVVGFVFSIKMEKDDGSIVTHPIATCSNVSDYIKEDATVISDDGGVKLNPTYYGKVATVQGQNVSARSLRLTHAVIEYWRPERSAESCEILKESFLRSMIF